MENAKYVINKYDDEIKIELEPINENVIKREFSDEFLLKFYEELEQEFSDDIKNGKFIEDFDKDTKNDIIRRMIAIATENKKLEIKRKLIDGCEISK